MLKVANSVINASQIATPISFAGDVTLSTGNLVIGTSGKGIAGTATNDNADAGVVGQLVSSTVASSGISLTDATFFVHQLSEGSLLNFFLKSL